MTSQPPPDEPAIGETVSVTYDLPLPASVPHSRICVQFGQALVAISRAHLEQLGASTEHPKVASDARLLLELARSTPDNILSRNRIDWAGLGDLDLLARCLTTGNAMIGSLRAGLSNEILSVSVTYHGMRPHEDTKILGFITYQFIEPGGRTRPSVTTDLFAVVWHAKAALPQDAPESASTTNIPSG